MNTAFRYASEHDIAVTGDYPYTGRESTCRHDSVTGLAGTTGFVNVTPYDPTALETAVREVGPISIALEAYNRTFMYYSGGIISKGCRTRLDHAITLVGYGNDGNTEYWIAKNSWSSNWGEQGYVHFKKDSKMGYGVCGILMANSYPTM
jgi:KDEL-tailed cysteine endopeptidase